MSVSRYQAVGSYAVKFNRDVSKCVYVANVSDQNVGVIATDDFFDEHEVLINITQSGSLVNLPFHLVVQC